MKIEINEHTDEYDSTGHFERLAEFLPFYVADMIVDHTSERLVDASLGKTSLTARRLRLEPHGTSIHIQYRNIGTIAARCDQLHLYVDTDDQCTVTVNTSLALFS